jgi:uncharacterized protein
MGDMAHLPSARVLKYGLSVQAVRTLTDIFAAQPKVHRALIYGSRAKGNFREGSDIDLVLDCPDLSFSEKLALDRAISNSNIPYLVDLSVLHELKSPELLEHIGRVGQVFYSLDQRAASVAPVRAKD